MRSRVGQGVCARAFAQAIASQTVPRSIGLPVSVPTDILAIQDISDRVYQ